MSRRFAVVYEAQADFQIATELADRVLVEFIDWMDEKDLENQRVWLRQIDQTPLTWTAIKKAAMNLRIRVSGHFDEEPAHPDARAARRAIRFLLYKIPDLAGLLLIRDQDDQPNRRAGLEQARKEVSGQIPVVIGLAVVERESWVVSGFEPLDKVEESRLEAERRELGFDPRLRSHELTACKDDTAKRSPKRVLGELSGGDRDRECSCWKETALDVLRERGAENGLTLYLKELRERLIPLIDRAP